MTREIAPFGLRLQPDLKNRLQAEAKANKRSLNAELIERLTRTVDQQDMIARNGYSKAEDPAAGGVASNDSERAMLALFRSMKPEKQLALLTLFK